LLSNTAFHNIASQDSTDLKNMKEIFEAQIVKNGVPLVIAGNNKHYSRTYPIVDGKFEKKKDLHSIDKDEISPTYININGPIENPGKTNVDDIIAWNSGMPSFGVLTVNQYSLNFELITEGHIQMDYFSIQLEDEPENDDDTEEGKLVLSHNL
jgi:hypothetical protein